MLTKVEVQNFKRFKDVTTFELKPDGVTFLAGGNNSGKSSLLQALAVWDFSRSVLESTHGAKARSQNHADKSVRLSAEEFSPIALPDLKHLFNNLRATSGTRAESSLKIKCHWKPDDDAGVERHLEFGMYLSNDRLNIKTTSSSLSEEELVPRLAYLPPFAGIGPHEQRMSTAARNRWIGRGLAGSVLRNMLYDLWENNRKARERIKDLRGRISRSSLAELRKSDAWEQLILVLEEIFKTGLTVSPFNERYHTKIDVHAWEGRLERKEFRRSNHCTAKDLMAEGSGFLQWLSVYVLSLSPEIHVLLLDEPDSHLHPALQGHLTHKLSQLARENRKQVLLATHSTTILTETSHDRIYRMENRGYLSDEGGRVGLFVGLGSQYAPRLDQLKKCKRLFLYEGPSDLEILKAWAKTLGYIWPSNLVCWKYTKDRAAREILFGVLQSEIQGLQAISLQDRDDYPFAKTKADLTFDNLRPFEKGLGLRLWRRRNIENYLLHPAAIARAAGVTEQRVQELMHDPHGINIPSDFTKSECVQTLSNTDGKVILSKHDRSISKEFGVDYKQVAEAMLPQEIPDDCKTLITQIVEMCRP